MVKVFITGATGLIGSAVAEAFARSGHKVIGLVRSEEAATCLAQKEMSAVVGDINNPDTWRHQASAAQVLIHCAADYSRPNPDEVVMSTLMEMASSSSGGPAKKTLVYTSGVWVYGHRASETVDESTKVNQSVPEFMSWRWDTEQQILADTSYRGIVIRPGVVFGGRGGLFSMLLLPSVLSGKGSLPSVPGDGSQFWSLIHREDLAAIYVAAVENIAFRGAVNAADGGATLAAILSEMAKAVNQNELSIQYRKPLLGLEEGVGSGARVDNTLAKRVLGFQSVHNFFMNTSRYIKAMQAYAAK